MRLNKKQKIFFLFTSITRGKVWENKVIKRKEVQYLSWPAWTAMDKGVFPLLSFTSGLAPFCKRQKERKSEA